MPTTTNYGWPTPTPSGSIDTWGTELNAAFDAADASLKTVADEAQPVDADLTAIAALAKTDGNFIVGNGTTWVAESGATARPSMGAYGAGSNASFGTIAATGAVTFSAGGTLGDASGDVVVIKGVTVHATTAAFLNNSSASAWRSDLGLGTAATANTGTSGGTVPLLNGNNTWSGTNAFAGITKSGHAVMRIATGTAANSGLVSFGTSAPGTLALGQIYLRHA